MKAILITGGIILLVFGIILVGGEGVGLTLNETILSKASGLLFIYLGYKAVVTAKPSLLEKD